MAGCPEVEEVIARYRPRGIPDGAAVFARAVVGAARPPGATRAKAWLFAAGRLGAFAASVGMDLEPTVVLSSPVIERFVAAIATEVSHPTRRTLRSNLVSLSGAVIPGPRPARLSRERARLPYSPAEIAAYLGLADAQPTPYRRLRAVGLICLGAGAGLVGVDLRAVRGTDIAARSGGVVVAVTAGRAPRTVPVLQGFHARLAEVSSYFGQALVVGGVELNRRNVTTPLISSLSGGADLARLDVRRLRATWLASVARSIGLRAFMDAAGITCSQRLGDVVGWLAPVEEADAVCLLGGGAP